MYIEKKKIPYIINSDNQIGYEMIRDYIEASRDTRTILRTNYNDHLNKKDNEMLDKLNKTIKDGLILYLEKCDRNCTLFFKNLIYNRTIINEKGETVIELSNYQIEPKYSKYKIYFSQNTIYDFRKEDYLNTLIINFNISASTTLKNELFKELALTYEPNLSNALNKTKIEVQKNLIRLYDNYTKLNNSIERFNFSSNVDELINNHNILDNYLRDIQENDFIMKNISNNKAKIINVNLNLMHFNTLCYICAKLFKLVNYVGDKKVSFKIFRDFIKKFYVENGYNEYEFDNIEKSDGKEKNEEGEEEEEEEVENKSNEETINEKFETIHKPKKVFSKEECLDLISYLHNNIVDKIYDDIEKKNSILFVEILFYLKEVKQLPYNYKNIIKNVVDLTFNQNIDFYKDKIQNNDSPLNNIPKENWNKLLFISEENENFLKNLIENINNNPKIWEELLEDKNKNSNWLSKDLNLDFLKEKIGTLPENLSIFNIFIFYVTIKPTNSIDNIIPSFITSIFNDSVTLFKYNSLEEIFKDPLTTFNLDFVPIIIVEHDDDIIMYEKFINDKLYPSLINLSSENSQQQTIQSKEMIKQSDKSLNLGVLKKVSGNTLGIKPSMEEEKPQTEIKSKVFELKEDISNYEMESINQFIKNGGIVFIRNIVNVNSETVEQLFQNIDDAKKNQTIHNTFRMIIFVDENHLNFSSIFYKKCIFVNYSDKTLDNYDAKKNLFNIIKNIPDEYFTFYNRSIYFKKIFVSFIFIHAMLIQLQKLNPQLFRFEIDINKGDLLQILYFFKRNFEYNEMDKELCQIDNDLNINFLHFINIALDIYYISRCAILEQAEKLKEILKRFFDEDVFFIEKNILIAYLQDIEDYEKNENLIIKIKEDETINAEFLFQKIEEISIERFQYLLNDFQKIILKEEIETPKPNRVDNLLMTLQKNILKIPIKEEKVKIKIYTKKILQILNIIKHDYPEQINYGEGFANAALFKLNKEGGYANPLDEVLIIEIDTLNNQLNEIFLELTNLINVIKGEMRVIHPYNSMIVQLNQNYCPYEWLRIIYLHKDNHKINLNINDWFKKLNEKITFYNDWVINAYPKIYSLNNFSHPKIFFEKLKLYFCRLENKSNEKDGKTPDMIELIFNPKVKNSNDIIIDGIILENAFLTEKDNLFYIKPDNHLNKVPSMHLGYAFHNFNEKKDILERNEFSESEIDKSKNKDNPMLKEELYLTEKNNLNEGKVIVPLIIENNDDFEPYITEIDYIGEIVCYFDPTLNDREKENMKINSCRFILKN